VSAVSTPKPAASGWASSKARPRQPDHETVPALTDPVGEDRDGHVGIAGPDRLDERTGLGRRGAQIAVQEQQVPGRTGPAWRCRPLHQPDRFGPGLHGGRLAAAAAVPDHRRSRVARQRGGVIGGPVVDHDDQVHPGQPGRTGHGRLDAVGLVVGRDDDGDVTTGGHAQILERPAAGPQAPVRMGKRY